MSGKYTIRYQSGKTFTLAGDFELTTVPKEGLVPCIVVGTQLNILDPRAIISHGEIVCYRPRNHHSQLAPWARQWLTEHPEWDAAEASA